MFHKKGRRILSGLLLFGFILGVSRGYVSVWQDEDPLPILRTDTPAASLLPEDQKLLHQGLRFESEGELTAALEDFCS